jgi:hypothetical protein
MANEPSFDWTQPASFGVHTVHEDGPPDFSSAGS